jgi:RimJ/RimL family protein N-acetyltransferase
VFEYSRNPSNGKQIGRVFILTVVQVLDRLRTAARTGLTSERVALEPLTVDHADEMVDVLSDPALYLFIGGEPPTATQLRDRYRRQVAGPVGSDAVWANWIVRTIDDRRAVGHVQATVVQDDSTWVADVAWVVGTPYQGRGLAGEAAALMMRHLARAGVPSFRAHIADANAASVAVAKRLGLRPTDSIDDGGERLFVGQL